MRTGGRTDAGFSWRVALVLAVAVGALILGAARAQEDVVKLGDLLAISNAGVYIVIEMGYFKEQGIRLWT